MLLSVLIAGVTTAAASTIHKRSSLASNNSTDTIVDLGSAGSYQGVTQNNGTYAIIYIMMLIQVHELTLHQIE
jgi:hypothetical protein